MDSVVPFRTAPRGSTTPSARDVNDAPHIVNDRPHTGQLYSRARAAEARKQISDQLDNCLWLTSLGRGGDIPLGSVFLGLLLVWEGHAIGAFNDPTTSPRKCAAALPDPHRTLTENEARESLEALIATWRRFRARGEAAAIILTPHVEHLAKGTTRAGLFLETVDLFTCLARAK